MSTENTIHPLTITIRLDDIKSQDSFNTVINDNRTSFSGGQSNIISLCILIHYLRNINSTKQQLLLIDEPDKHLHSKTQEELIKNLYKQTENNPNLQIIYSTHSSHMVHPEKIEDIRIMLQDTNNANGKICFESFKDNLERIIKLDDVKKYYIQEGVNRKAREDIKKKIVSLISKHDLYHIFGYSAQPLLHMYAQRYDGKNHYKTYYEIIYEIIMKIVGNTNSRDDRGVSDNENKENTKKELGNIYNDVKNNKEFIEAKKKNRNTIYLALLMMTIDIERGLGESEILRTFKFIKIQYRDNEKRLFICNTTDIEKKCTKYAEWLKSDNVYASTQYKECYNEGKTLEISTRTLAKYLKNQCDIPNTSKKLPSPDSLIHRIKNVLSNMDYKKR